ncbi:MAG TPA: type VII secretion-associated serine protease mycosin [Pseudonocardiaceae bacterium]|jgi:membrane-anchored mycosin MYCP|nr:type VII secretion-associated serine protease mycosin [Pseudonocardiaceae bacterium]
MSRTTRVPYRIAAAATATLLVLLGPAWPAFADSVALAGIGAGTGLGTDAGLAAGTGLGMAADGNPAAGTSPTGPANWEPPPLPANPQYPPDEGPGGAPDKAYALNTNGQGGCITSGVTQPITRVPAAQSMLDIADAQKISTGRNVTVAVIDTGVNPHPFFGNRLENGGDYIQSDGKGEFDCDGHGTIVAGIIAADTRGTGLGFIGVAPDANILAIRQTDGNYVDAQGDPAGDLTTLAEAIYYAATVPAVKVITMSVDNCNTLANAQTQENSQPGQLLQAAIHYAVDVADKVVVAAAGNIPNGNTADQNSQGNAASQSASSNPCASVPQNDDPDGNAVKQVEIPPVYANDVLSVASVNPNTGDPSTFTEWGPWVSVAAPGENIISVDPAPNGTLLADRTQQNGSTVLLQGTSFAAPYVAGLAALIRSKFPTLTARQVMYRIEATAQHPSGPGGRNNEVGYGVIDPVAALTALIPGQNGVPVSGTTQIKAQAPNSGNLDSLPMRIALIGTGGAALLLLIIYFIVRTNRHNRRSQQPQT